MSGLQSLKGTSGAWGKSVISAQNPVGAIGNSGTCLRQSTNPYHLSTFSCNTDAVTNWKRICSAFAVCEQLRVSRPSTALLCQRYTAAPSVGNQAHPTDPDGKALPRLLIGWLKPSHLRPSNLFWKRQTASHSQSGPRRNNVQLHRRPASVLARYYAETARYCNLWLTWIHRWAAPFRIFRHTNSSL